MKIKELKEKPLNELNKLLKESQDKLREMNFKVSQRQLKNVRELRRTKRMVARIFTLLKQKSAKV